MKRRRDDETPNHGGDEPRAASVVAVDAVIVVDVNVYVIVVVFVAVIVIVVVVVVVVVPVADVVAVNVFGVVVFDFFSAVDVVWLVFISENQLYGRQRSSLQSWSHHLPFVFSKVGVLWSKEEEKGWVKVGSSPVK